MSQTIQILPSSDSSDRPGKYSLRKPLWRLNNFSCPSRSSSDNQTCFSLEYPDDGSPSPPPLQWNHPMGTVVTIKDLPLIRRTIVAWLHGFDAVS